MVMVMNRGWMRPFFLYIQLQVFLFLSSLSPIGSQRLMRTEYMNMNEIDDG
jgi:hypothetical protein